MPRQANTSAMRRRASREDELPIDFFKCGVVISFLIFLGGLLNCINFLRFIFSPLVDSIFPFVVFAFLAPLHGSHFWPFTEVQNGNQREVTRKCGNFFKPKERKAGRLYLVSYEKNTVLCSL